VKNENISSEFSSSSICSLNTIPSKDGGSCRKELNERESKMHKLRTKFEKEKRKNTYVDGLLVLTKLCKIEK
jgi:hypothetical protein